MRGRGVELYRRPAAQTAAQRRHRPRAELQRAALAGGVGRGGAGRRPGGLLWLYGPRMPGALLAARGRDPPRCPAAPWGPHSRAGEAPAPRGSSDGWNRSVIPGAHLRPSTSTKDCPSYCLVKLRKASETGSNLPKATQPGHKRVMGVQDSTLHLPLPAPRDWEDKVDLHVRAVVSQRFRFDLVTARARLGSLGEEAFVPLHRGANPNYGSKLLDIFEIFQNIQKQAAPRGAGGGRFSRLCTGF